MPDRNLNSHDAAGDEWLSSAEVAAQLKVNVQTVRVWVREGRLRAVRTGASRYRIRRSDVQHMLNDGESPAFQRREPPAGESFVPPVSEFHDRLSLPTGERSA